MTPEEADRLDKVLESATRSLGEHFDTVQIFVSRYDSSHNSDTINFTSGTGPWNQRHGQVREWVIRHDEMVREKARRDFSTETEE